VANRVEDTVRELVGKVLRVAPADVDLDMPIDEAADSLELSALFVAAERSFGIQLDDALLGRIRVVRDLATFIERQLATRE
jgi:acyl carrier protein